MNGKLIAGLMLGLVLGFGLALLVRQPEARAADTAQKWEYKAVKLDGERSGGLNLDDVNGGTFEFLMMCAPGGRDSGCIALFRRPKK
jgi:hypothetical protein